MKRLASGVLGVGVGRGLCGHLKVQARGCALLGVPLPRWLATKGGSCDPLSAERRSARFKLDGTVPSGHRGGNAPEDELSRGGLRVGTRTLRRQTWRCKRLCVAGERCRSGEAEAIWLLGSRLWRRSGVARDRKRARKLFYESALLGHPSGQVDYGNLCCERTRFLASFFPDGAPQTMQEAAAVFLQHENDPHCQYWAAECGAEPRDELYRRSAEGGYGLGQWLHASMTGLSLSVLEMAAEQNVPEAMTMLTLRLARADLGPVESERSCSLLKEAAELGCSNAQIFYGCKCTVTRQSGSDGCAGPHCKVDRELRNWLNALDCSCHSTSRIASVDTFCLSWERLCVFAQVERIVNQANNASACERTIELYNQWTAEAKRAVLCWMWFSRTVCSVKDIRLMIANLIWDERIAWSEFRIVWK